MEHERFMRRALELAWRGMGYVAPNPMVGAVLVRDGRIIGEGYHQRYGEKHAEVMAIENAGEPVRGATLYCNLEPCCDGMPAKKTPSCARRLVAEGIAAVFTSTVDPNPYVSGKGIEILRAAGIRVNNGLLRDEALALNECYFRHVQSGEPFVNLKMAMSLDGRIATAGGESRWISNPAARQLVHRLRAQYDAVLVGIETVIADDPQLTVRHVSGRQPWRVVLDSQLRIPGNSTLLRDEFIGRTVIVTTPVHPVPRGEELMKKGVRLLVVDTDDCGRCLPDLALRKLTDLGISSILVEGGRAVFTSFLREKCFDKITAFVAPMIIGEGISAVGDLGVTRIEAALRLQKVRYTPIDDQLLITGYRDLQSTFGILESEKECLQV